MRITQGLTTRTLLLLKPLRKSNQAWTSKYALGVSPGRCFERLAELAFFSHLFIQMKAAGEMEQGTGEGWEIPLALIRSFMWHSLPVPLICSGESEEALHFLSPRRALTKFMVQAKWYQWEREKRNTWQPDVWPQLAPSWISAAWLPWASAPSCLPLGSACVPHGFVPPQVLVRICSLE